MHIQRLESSSCNQLGGQVSHLLLWPGQFGSRHMSITWIVAAPGSVQSLHQHPENEQVFVIVQGIGRMTVGAEQQKVGPGTLVFVPPGERHGIENVGPDELVVVSASSPPFGLPGEGAGFEYEGFEGMGGGMQRRPPSVPP